MLVGGTGYIRIENFHTGVAKQFRNVLDTLTGEGMTSLVIDVRHNGGGKVKEMSEILDPLLPEGTIMTLREKDGHETVYSSDADMIDLPIAVLIDDQSISAASSSRRLAGIRARDARRHAHHRQGPRTAHLCALGRLGGQPVGRGIFYVLREKASRTRASPPISRPRSPMSRPRTSIFSGRTAIRSFSAR